DGSLRHRKLERRQCDRFGQEIAMIFEEGASFRSVPCERTDLNRLSIKIEMDRKRLDVLEVCHPHLARHLRRPRRRTASAMTSLIDLRAGRGNNCSNSFSACSANAT